MYKGFNGENWFQAQDENVKTWLGEMIEEGETFCLRFRQDKPDSDPSDIDKLIDLRDYLGSINRGIEVIFCANIKEDAEAAFARLQTVINAGINVIAVEFGNEVYSKEQANFDFNVYKEWFTPLHERIKGSYPTMPCLVFMAPRPKESGVLGPRSDHSKFNEAAIEYINSDPSLHPTVHIYFNSKECPTLMSRPANIVYSPEGAYPEWDTFYAAIMNEALSNVSLWTNTLGYLSQRMPGKGIYITEWGFDNYGTIKNTFGTAIVAWNIWLLFASDSRITALCQHNGVSMSTPGMMFPSNDKDLNPNSYPILRRLDYFIYKLFRKYERLSAQSPNNPYTAFYSQDHAAFGNCEGEYIDGKALYEGSGMTSWMAKGTTPSYQVSGIKQFNGGIVEADTVSIGFYRELPIPNTPPVADAGPDQTLYLPKRTSSIKATLTAEDSFDLEGDLTYKWFYDGALVGTEVTTEVSLTRGTHTFTLEVTDSEGATAMDTVTITVKKRLYFFNIPLPTFNLNFY